ncbi:MULTISPECIES: sugar ABC transporter substrate-binding protein [Streptosporangium]|uniref:D-xylose transport system substrate-binding protein n=1 Tax=Streptosporangium brasiliense TaxID=47480 RepID=A0ABT9R7P5_9ACTN|nr:substrate-binding domain-containing protein [Streptosporangium brasiliense]MDP9864829.1 D-xylose transport system substrate-binding protein [Streptosporangium brasiliense]
MARLAAGGMAVVAAFGLTACGVIGRPGSDETASAPGRAVAEGFKIGLLLPGTEATRYEKFDRPYITESVAELCPRCQVVYGSAGRDHDRQRRQFDSMLGDGVKVIILDAVDAKAIAPSVSRAVEQGVKVIAYDRLAGGPIDAYTSFDNVQIGKMQGQALLDALKAEGDPRRGPIVMINGSPADPNAGDFKKGVHSVLDGNVVIGGEYDIPGWSSDLAASDAAGAFATLGPERVIGVYAANDGMAGGAARAMRITGIAKGTPLTGQDAELAAIQRVLLGTQTMTIYKPIRPEARNAAQMAVDLGSGRTVTGGADGEGTVANGTSSSIPAQIIQPIVVTKDNIEDTVVKDGLWKVEEICTADLRAACKSAGLT